MSYNSHLAKAGQVGIVAKPSSAPNLNFGATTGNIDVFSRFSSGSDYRADLYTLITEQIVTTSTSEIAFTHSLMDFSSTLYLITIDNVIASSASQVDLLLQFKASGSGSYTTSNYQTYNALGSAKAATNGIVCGYGISSGIGQSSLTLHDPGKSGYSPPGSSATFKATTSIQATTTLYNSGANSLSYDYVTGSNLTFTSAIEAVKLFFASGTILSGTFRLYYYGPY